MAWKSLWITPCAVLGALRPPEEKKARPRVTASPPLSWTEIVLLSFVVVWILARLALEDRQNPAEEELSHALGPGLMPARLWLFSWGS